jgi:hypothetical protein
MFGIGYETSYPIRMIKVAGERSASRSLTEGSALRNDPPKFKGNEVSNRANSIEHAIDQADGAMYASKQARKRSGKLMLI